MAEQIEKLVNDQIFTVKIGDFGTDESTYFCHYGIPLYESELGMKKGTLDLEILALFSLYSEEELNNYKNQPEVVYAIVKEAVETIFPQQKKTLHSVYINTKPEIDMQHTYQESLNEVSTIKEAPYYDLHFVDVESKKPLEHTIFQHDEILMLEISTNSVIENCFLTIVEVDHQANRSFHISEMVTFSNGVGYHRFSMYSDVQEPGKAIHFFCYFSRNPMKSETAELADGSVVVLSAHIGVVAFSTSIRKRIGMRIQENCLDRMLLEVICKELDIAPITMDKDPETGRGLIKAQKAYNLVVCSEQSGFLWVFNLGSQGDKDITLLTNNALEIKKGIPLGIPFRLTDSVFLSKNTGLTEAFFFVLQKKLEKLKISDLDKELIPAKNSLDTAGLRVRSRVDSDILSLFVNKNHSFGFIELEVY